MERFSLPMPGLLFLIFELQSRGAISQAEKHRLKGECHTVMVLTDNDKVGKVQAEFAETGDRKTLESSLIRLGKVNQRSRPVSPLAIPKRKQSREADEESSSPLGTFLRERKKHQRGEMELKLNLCTPIPPTQTAA